MVGFDQPADHVEVALPGIPFAVAQSLDLDYEVSDPTGDAVCASGKGAKWRRRETRPASYRNGLGRLQEKPHVRLAGRSLDPCYQARAIYSDTLTGQISITSARDVEGNAGHPIRPRSWLRLRRRGCLSPVPAAAAHALAKFLALLRSHALPALTHAPPPVGTVQRTSAEAAEQQPAQQNKPTACQKVISRHPNSEGSSQFHSCTTRSAQAPIMTTRMNIPNMTFNVRLIHLVIMFAFLTFS